MAVRTTNNFAARASARSQSVHDQCGMTPPSSSSTCARTISSIVCSERKPMDKARLCIKAARNSGEHRGYCRIEFELPESANDAPNGAPILPAPTPLCACIVSQFDCRRSEVARVLIRLVCSDDRHSAERRWPICGMGSRQAKLPLEQRSLPLVRVMRTRRVGVAAARNEMLPMGSRCRAVYTLRK